MILMAFIKMNQFRNCCRSGSIKSLTEIQFQRAICPRNSNAAFRIDAIL